MTALDTHTVARYCAPLVLAVLLFLAMQVWYSRGPDDARWRNVLVAAVALGWLAVPATSRRVFEVDRYSNLRGAQAHAEDWAAAAIRATNADLVLDRFDGRGDYEKAQSLLPVTARVVSAAEMPFHWRFDRQTIHSLDLLGQVSPDPGMPFFVGAEAAAKYLTELGYTHLAFTPPRTGACLFSARHWQWQQSHGAPMWRKWAPYFLDFMRTERELARTREVVYRAPSLVVVDLRTRTSGAAPRAARQR
jgi:hypothetical protein